MTGLLGSILDGVMVYGLRGLEMLFPGPRRLADPVSVPRSTDPVILVSGFANRPEGWQTWERSLKADGFDTFVFDMPTDGLGDIYESTDALRKYAEAVAATSPTGKIDLIGFSEGGIVSRLLVGLYGGDRYVDSVVTLATPNHGMSVNKGMSIYRKIPVLGSALPIAVDQLLEGSQLLKQMDAMDAKLRKNGPVRYASIYAADFDGFVFPKSAHLSGAKNIPLDADRHFIAMRGPSHYSIYHYSHDAYNAARKILLKPHKKKSAAVQQVAAGVSHLRLRKTQQRRTTRVQAAHTQASGAALHRRRQIAR